MSATLGATVGAKNGLSCSAADTVIDAGLQTIIDAWRRLSISDRAVVVATVRGMIEQ